MPIKKNVILAKYGDEGEKVLTYQKALKVAGSKIQVNGKYTIGMVSAVKAFQKKNKLEVNGKIDTKTDAKLNEYLKPKPKAKRTAKTK